MSAADDRMDQYKKVPTDENEKKSGKNDLPAQTSYGYGIRHVQLAIFFTCLSTTFIARGHLGVTIVAMTSHQQAKSFADNATDINGFEVGNISIANDTEISIRNETIERKDEADVEWTIYRTYDWSKPIQETVLSSFFLGYCLTTFPAALVCQRWGGKVPLQIGLLINGLVSLLTPFLTLWGGWKAVCICRVMQGLTQAGTYPGLQTLLAKWVPIKERATLSSYLYAGATLGNIIGFQMSGILAGSAWGWPSTFWAIGVICLLCFVFLTVFGDATPLTHSSISEEEKSYIFGQSDTILVQRKRSAPWKAILTSGPVYANFATHVGSGLAYIFFFTQVPSYIHYILGIDVKSSGILSSLPYFASFFTSVAFGLVSDYSTNRKIISIKTARRIFNSISQVGVATGLVCASFTNSLTVAVCCFVLTMSCHMGVHAGWMLNHIDLSPEYSGTLMALGNTLMNLTVMIMPVLVSNIVVDVRNPSQWRTIMFLVAGISFLTNILFCMFLSEKMQPWNEGIVDDAEIENTNETSVEGKQPKEKE